jgi:ACR3 family arsenite efflux pump ArsB
VIRVPNNRASLENAFLGRLRVAALIAMLVGAMGSVGFMLYAGRRNPSQLLIFLFVIWVLSPFVLLGLANIISQRWSGLTRATLYGVTLLLTLSSLAIYAYRALGPPRPQAAFIFIVVPPASWLFIAIAVSLAGLLSARLTRRGSGN